MEKEKPLTNIEEKESFEEVMEDPKGIKKQRDWLRAENEELRRKIDELIKRYKKLTILYNEVLEKFLSE